MLNLDNLQLLVVVHSTIRKLQNHPTQKTKQKRLHEIDIKVQFLQESFLHGLAEAIEVPTPSGRHIFLFLSAPAALLFSMASLCFPWDFSIRTSTTKAIYFLVGFFACCAPSSIVFVSYVLAIVFLAPFIYFSWGLWPI